MRGHGSLKDLMLIPNNLSGCVPAGVPDIWVGQSGLPRCDSSEAGRRYPQKVCKRSGGVPSV